MRQETYHDGGLVPGAPMQNLAERWDSTTSTYTRWDTAGTQLEKRALTSTEVDGFAAQEAAVTAGTNEAAIRAAAADALAANRTFLAVAAPTNAQIVAQVRALTRQNNALIRLTLRQFSGTD